MKITIENDLTGPLSHKPIIRKIEAAIERAASLDDAARALRALNIPSIACYKGGSHIAIHEQLRDGHLWPERLALVTEGSAP